MAFNSANYSTVDVAVLRAFGEKFTYTPSGSAAVELTGLYQEDEGVIQVGEVAVELNGASLCFLKADVGQPSNLDTVIVKGINYRVSDVIEDEATLTVVTLLKV